jgi:hypothetical protein
LRFGLDEEGLNSLSKDPVWDTENGELRILGERHIAIDAQTLCNHLDSLVGVKVAEVIMHNIQFRLGKVDATRLRTEKPQSSLTELIEHLTNSERLSGTGITKVVLPENLQESILIEVTNPAVKGTAGSAKEFLVAWWAGALSVLCNKELDVKHISYDEGSKVLRGGISAR